ncbi:MAG TPA: hypothetical protein PK685_02910 [archaeon]|nr:hypothetical protein [archaeon]
MSTTTDIKTIKFDPDSLYRSQRIKFSSSKIITTPTKTIPLDKFNLKQNINPTALQLNEVFKRFTASQIKEANEDCEKEDKVNEFFNSQKNKIKENTATLCILDFNEIRIPTEEEIGFLTAIGYCNSDISVIPTLSHFSDSKSSPINYEDYKKYLDLTIEIIEQLNHKPIMGIIPRLSSKNILDLLNFYHDKGINSFALDLDGRNPVSSSTKIFKILRTLNKQKLLDTSYIHAHNVGMRVNKITDTIPAKDILGFGLGLDSIGEKRKEFKPNKTFIEFIKQNPLNKFRLFNKNDYCYWKTISLSDLKNVYPADSSISFSEFKEPVVLRNAALFNKLQYRFNSEQLSIESNNIKKIISEDSENTLKYIKKKKGISTDDIKVIESAPNKIKKK